MNEKDVLEDLLKDAEALVGKLRARLAEHHGTGQAALHTDTLTASAIERVQSQKTSDNTGNY